MYARFLDDLISSLTFFTEREREENRVISLEFLRALLSMIVLHLLIDIKYVNFSQKPRNYVYTFGIALFNSIFVGTLVGFDH